jgi:putative endonuclease
MAKHNEIGKLGEEIACKWLISHGYSVIQQNYWKKFGEIDIVARETTTMHFIEVKSVSYGTKHDLDYAVSHETWRPEENVHKNKQRKLKNAIQAWLIEHYHDGEWQIDVLSVQMVPRERYALVKLLGNVIFD